MNTHTVVVVERVQTQALQFGQKPPGDEVDGQPAVGDVGDVGGDLREDQRIEQQRLDRADQLDARRRLGERRNRRPRFENVVLGVAGVDDVLCQQGGVEPCGFGTQQQVAGAAVARVRRVVRMQCARRGFRIPAPTPRTAAAVSRAGQVALAFPVADLVRVLHPFAAGQRREVVHRVGAEDVGDGVVAGGQFQCHAE